MADSLPRQEIDIYSDFHIHTAFCNHASGTMEEYVEHAIPKGLTKIVFLEHMEEGIRSERQLWLGEAEFAAYFQEGRRLQGKYAGRIEIGLGVECGFNRHHADTLRNRLAAREWDEIGISCHFLELTPETDHLNLLSRKQENITRAMEHNLHGIFARYLEQLTDAVSVLPGTILCHLDAALRYVPGFCPAEEHYQQIENLLDIVQSRQMAIEYNTSGIAIRGELFPASRIRQMADARKIPVVLSSDAHRPEDVGRNFSDLKLCP